MRTALTLVLALWGCGGAPANQSSSAPSVAAGPTNSASRVDPAVAPEASPGASVAILSPPNDSIHFATQLTLQGTVDPPGAVVTVTVGGQMFPVDVNAGTWSSVVTLPAGTNVIVARSGAASDDRVVTLGADVAQREAQKVRFDWRPGVEEQLRRIARGTLLNPSDTKVEAFVDGVKLMTPTVLVRAYDAFDVVEVAPNVDGADVHTIELLVEESDFFGQSLYDCGNQVLRQSSQVLVGTYRATLVDEFTAWGPMRKTDSLQTRIEDVAAALGRTSAHELGHSIGFVGSELGQPCGWMMGCDGGHNCSELSPNLAKAERFGSGRFIMDPGGKTLNNFRLAEAAPNERGARTPSVFTAFDRSYLTAVHPRQ